MIDRRLLLKAISDSFGGLLIDNFDNRLILQKRFYLLQKFGVDLGYRYNWYAHGPYCPTLTEDAYRLQTDTSST
ncbi:MAG: hypothetical protein WAV13_04585, partial [Thermodesulfovibrionales bacterium]